MLLMSQGSMLTRCADLALGVALPIHSHIAVNNVISDYVPKNVAGEVFGCPMTFLPRSLLRSRCCSTRDVCPGCSVGSCDAAAPCAGASRWAALGASTVALLGLLNLNINGPGITATVKSLWKSPEH